jgi:ribosomal protein S18 acetylase RimI-like enzyme
LEWQTVKPDGGKASLDPCELLKWDTELFGFRIGRVCGDVLTQEQVQQIDAWCRRTRVRCLYFLSCVNDPNTIRLAEDNDFRLVDIRVTFRRGVAGISSNPISRMDCAAIVRRARPEDTRSLKRIARSNYRDTRFHFDINFPRGLSDLLYETWIERSCEGYADEVLVAELDSMPVGYISCHLDADSRSGRVGLLGVSNRARGLGIGRALVLSASEWFSARGIQEINLVTQGRNYAAQRLYQRCGFLTQSVQFWYHKWFAPEGVTDE